MPARQKRSNFFVVAALAAAMLIPFPALAKVIKAAGNEFTHKAVTEARLRSQVEFLSGAHCAGRMMGSEGSKRLRSGLQRSSPKGEYCLWASPGSTDSRRRAAPAAIT